MPTRLIERLFLLRHEPTAEEMHTLVSQIEQLLAQLEKQVSAHLLPDAVIRSLRKDYDAQRAPIQHSMRILSPSIRQLSEQ